MKTNKKTNKASAHERKINRGQNKELGNKNSKDNLNKDFKESLQEDKRGPMEGMEEGVAKQ